MNDRTFNTSRKARIEYKLNTLTSSNYDITMYSSQVPNQAQAQAQAQAQEFLLDLAREHKFQRCFYTNVLTYLESCNDEKLNARQMYITVLNSMQSEPNVAYDFKHEFDSSMYSTITLLLDSDISELKNAIGYVETLGQTTMDLVRYLKCFAKGTERPSSRFNKELERLALSQDISQPERCLNSMLLFTCISSNIQRIASDYHRIIQVVMPSITENRDFLRNEFKHI
jgi:hypothetical protein